MSEILHTPGERDRYRAFRTAAKLAGVRSVDQMHALMRDIGKALAEQLVAAGIPITSRRFRPDVGPVQIDLAFIEEMPSRPEPLIRLQFEVEGEMGVDLKVKLVDFLRDPQGYTQGLFQHLAPMRRNVLRRRRDRRALDTTIYAAIQGAANG